MKKCERVLSKISSPQVMRRKRYEIVASVTQMFVNAAKLERDQKIKAPLVKANPYSGIEEYITEVDRDSMYATQKKETT